MAKETTIILTVLGCSVEVTATDADDDDGEENVVPVLTADRESCIKEESPECTCSVGVAGVGGVGPLMRAKSLLLKDKATDIATANGVEREFHSNGDNCTTTERVNKSRAGALTTCKSADVKCAAPVAESNKFEVTKVTSEVPKDKDRETVASFYLHL